MWGELTSISFPHHPGLLRREEVEKIWNEVEPGKKRGVGESCFKI